jgi:hypothetical protein
MPTAAYKESLYNVIPAVRRGEVTQVLFTAAYCTHYKIYFYNLVPDYRLN